MTCSVTTCTSLRLWMVSATASLLFTRKNLPRAQRRRSPLTPVLTQMALFSSTVSAEWLEPAMHSDRLRCHNSNTEYTCTRRIVHMDALKHRAAACSECAFSNLSQHNLSNSCRAGRRVACAVLLGRGGGAGTRRGKEGAGARGHERRGEDRGGRGKTTDSYHKRCTSKRGIPLRCR